jgi:hypothetical protein
MTMENRALVYAVLAISLGYLLVSAVPSQLAPPMFSESIEDRELTRRLQLMMPLLQQAS